MRKSVRKSSQKKTAANKPKQLVLFSIKRYFLFLPVAAVLAGFVLIYSLQKTQNDMYEIFGPGFKNISSHFVPGEKVAYFDGKPVDAPKEIPTYLAKGSESKFVLGDEANSGERWIEVDLSNQKLIAHEGDHVFLETLVSTGKAWTPTPTGEYKVWYKAKAQKMSGGEGSSYYYLPNVPYIMFFQNESVPGSKGFSLHGTYWHNNFGHEMSHGCVNLPTPIAEKLYYWTTPTLENSKNIVRATTENPGTRIVIHE